MPAPSLVTISRTLAREVDAIDTSTVASFAYNPLNYARAPHEAYLKTYGGGPKQALFLGMNPGPFGMAQTGVPFGDVRMVRDYLKLEGKVARPEREHPKRPIEGFSCKKSEVSGTRLWGLAQAHFPDAKDFFARFFVVNYCPLVFMNETGGNITPDKLPRDVREAIERCCDKALLSLVTLLEPEWVIGVGAFAEKQAKRAVAATRVKIATILHPSPASPAANRGWAPQVEKQLAQLGIEF